MAQRPIRQGGMAWRELRVGVLLILGLTLLGYGIFRIGDLLQIFTDRYALFTMVPNVIGLTQGAAVTLAGQRVGQVDEIEFVPIADDERYRLVLRLSVDVEARRYIRADSEARIRTLGLLGDRYVDITPGTPVARVLLPGDTLPSIAAIEFEEILALASGTLVEVQSLIGELRVIAAGIRQGEGTIGQLLTDRSLYDRMVGATDEIRDLIAGINRADGTLGRLIRDPALYEQLGAVVARIDTLGAAVLHGEGTLPRLLRDDEIYQGLLGVVGRADTTLAAIGLSLEGLTAGEGTIQRLLTDPALYDELLKAVVDLQILINDVRLNPRQYRPEVRIRIF